MPRMLRMGGRRVCKGLAKRLPYTWIQSDGPPASRKIPVKRPDGATGGCGWAAVGEGCVVSTSITFMCV